MADWWKDVWKEPVGSKAWREARESEWPTEEELRRDLEEEIQKYEGRDERSPEPDNKAQEADWPPWEVAPTPEQQARDAYLDTQPSEAWQLEERLKEDREEGRREWGSFEDAYERYASSDLGPQAETPKPPGVPDTPER